MSLHCNSAKPIAISKQMCVAQISNLRYHCDTVSVYTVTKGMDVEQVERIYVLVLIFSGADAEGMELFAESTLPVQMVPDMYNLFQKYAKCSS